MNYTLKHKLDFHAYFPSAQNLLLINCSYTHIHTHTTATGYFQASHKTSGASVTKKSTRGYTHIHSANTHGGFGARGYRYVSDVSYTLFSSKNDTQTHTPKKPVNSEVHLTHTNIYTLD